MAKKVKNTKEVQLPALLQADVVRGCLLIKDAEGEPKQVDLKNYCTAKAKQMNEFGYNGVTDAEVSEQLQKIIKDEQLSIIGMFIKDDLAY